MFVKQKYKMCKSIPLFISTVIVGLLFIFYKSVIDFPISITSPDDIMPKKMYVEESFGYFMNSLKILLIQINLGISFINKNWDCFKNKSEKILGSKE